MSSPPTVLLSPRTPVRLPTGEIEIPPPPSPPSKPSGSLLLQILPVLFAAIGMGIILLVGSVQAGGMMAVLLVATLLMVGGGAVVSVLVRRSQNASFRAQTRERVELYYRMLIDTRDRVDSLLVAQQRLLLGKDPDPAGCVQIVAERGPHLWERSPEDADFVELRVGLGSLPSSVPVRPPRQPDPLRSDPLVEAAEDLARWGNQLEGVPIRVPLIAADNGPVGVCGPRSSVLECARAVVVQLATLHAPDEVKLVSLVPPAEAQEWSWLRWLPHCWSEDRRERFVATTPAEATRLSKRLEEVLGRRRDATTRFGLYPSAADRKLPLPVFVFLVADEGLAESMPVLSRLSDANACQTLGVSGVFVSSHRTRLPRSCRTILELPEAALTLPDGEVHQLAIADGASVQLAAALADGLAPLRVKRVASAAGLPNQVTLLELLGVQTVEELDVVHRWKQARPERSLAVPIGVRPGGETLHLDLHQLADGPHGLLAGSTGSGKSALLQALLLGLAAAFHPHDVAIVLVDYKGGSTAGPLQRLPHLVGIITNLDGNLARRALVALQAEIERRQAALVNVGCDDLDAYLTRRRQGEPLPPIPHLILVVDEFAELKTERPDFIHQLVRTARVGRSVGVHLILATQKPRPAVDDEIWANARFRICLRVEQPQDSHDVLKRPDAAALVGRGQGYLQVGQDEVFTLFLGGWGGAAYRPEVGPTDPHEILQVSLDGTRRSIRPVAQQDGTDRARMPTEAEAVASYLRHEADAAGIATLPAIWLEPLRDRVSLSELVDTHAGWWTDSRQRAPTRWVEPVLGLADDPAHRRQSALRINLPTGGNLVVYGAPGSGKTTALLTLAMALATEHTPDEVHMYLLDFGGQALSTLRDLPHVGGVVLGDEEEKLVRLLRRMTRELAQRKALFAEAGVGTLPAYRAATHARLPAVVLLIDNAPALVHTYEDMEDDLAHVAQQGGTAGIHVVISAPSPTLVRLRLANSFSQAVMLRLADRADYGAVLSVPEGYETPAQAGRGLVKGRPTLECQVAVPAAGSTEADQTATVRRLAYEMTAAWSGARPWVLRTLPERVVLADLIQHNVPIEGPVVPVGLSVDDLEPLVVDLRDGPHFVISGPPRGGKSTLLNTWLTSLQRCISSDQLRLCLADFSAEADPPPGVRCARVSAELAAFLDEMAAVDDGCLTAVLAIDDFDALKRCVDPEVLERLDRLVRSRRSSVHVVLVGSSGSLGASYEGVGQAIRETQTGFIVGGSDYDDLHVLGVSVPHAEASQGMPPGQGYYVRRKRYTRVKFAATW